MKRKILIATDSFLPRWDGISRFLIELIPYLREDYEITILAPDFPGEAFVIDQVEVVRIKVHHFSIGDYPLPTFQKRKVQHHVEQADLVFSQSIGPIGSIAINHAHAIKKPLLAFIHSVEWELVAKSISHSKMVESFVYHLFKGYIKKLYNKCNLIITPSEELSEILQANGITSLKTVVHLGIDIDRFKPADKSKAKEAVGIDPENIVIGFVGRIGREKDLLTLYKAFKKIEKMRKKVKLLIVGEGLSSIKHTLSQNKHVILAGSQKNVVPYYQAMDIYVLPSLTETSSLSTMEAMACGIPVIASKVGFIKYYIKDKENGVFFPKRNEVILGLKIEWLLDNPYVRTTLGNNARKTIVEHYNWEKTVNKIKFILEGF